MPILHALREGVYTFPEGFHYMFILRDY